MADVKGTSDCWVDRWSGVGLLQSFTKHCNLVIILTRESRNPKQTTPFVARDTPSTAVVLGIALGHSPIGRLAIKRHI